MNMDMKLKGVAVRGKVGRDRGIWVGANLRLGGMSEANDSDGAREGS